MILLELLQGKGRATIALLFFLLLSVIVIQTIRINDYREISQEYSEEIEELKKAALLTERLRRDNAEIIQERDDLLEDIQHAEGADTLLPPDVSAIVNSVQ